MEKTAIGRNHRRKHGGSHQTGILGPGENSRIYLKKELSDFAEKKDAKKGRKRLFRYCSKREISERKGKKDVKRTTKSRQAREGEEGNNRHGRNGLTGGRRGMLRKKMNCQIGTCGHEEGPRNQRRGEAKEKKECARVQEKKRRRPHWQRRKAKGSPRKGPSRWKANT